MTCFGLLLVLVPATLVVAIAGTGVLRWYALRKNLLDIPNKRSSHAVPTPRGGGVAIVGSATVAFAVLRWLGWLDNDLFLALSVGGLAVAVIGFMDDRRSLPASIRIVVHFLSACWVLWTLGGVPPVQLGAETVNLGLMGDVFGVLAIVWMLNLFNFMDGIDGIAASEAVFVAGVGAMLVVLFGESTSIPAAACVLAAASLGFLVWNWPPAKIFMGDVGSGYLGFTLAVLAVAATHENSALGYAWLLLGGYFIVDATVTLFRRLMRRERVYEAHRSHAYQWLARRWNSHRRVTLAVWAVNLFWFLPCTIVLLLFQDHAIEVVTSALTVVAVVVVSVGAGRPDNV